jgi:uncharacterized surface protein with fasciclin (FAS1) repeats
MRVLRLTILGLASTFALIACGSSAVDSATTAAASAPAAVAGGDTTVPQAPPTAAGSSVPVTPPPTEAAPEVATTALAIPTTTAPTLNLLDTALENGSFNILSSLLGSADLIGTLDGNGPFTVFAPTDAAFAALPAGLLDALVRPDNRDALVRVLTYHVLAGRLPGSSVVAGMLTTLEGSAATVAVDGGVKIDAANVVAVDVQATNGVIHVVDAVLVPPGLDIAAILAPPVTQAPRTTRPPTPQGTEAPHTTDAPHNTEPPAPQPTDAPHGT